MLGFSAVVAIVASGAAFFVVLGVVTVVVWVRVRKERQAMRMLGLKEGDNPRSIKPYNADTLTEISHLEGSVLRTHGQLPYGKPNEWGQMESHETLLRPKSEPKSEPESSWPLVERARSLRNSIRRARSKRFTKGGLRRMGSMATVSEMMPSPRSSKDDIPLSALEGILELPAERTPRQTPEIPREEEGFHLGMRPMSPAVWPPPSQQPQANVFPVMDSILSPDLFDLPPMISEESPTRIRGGSIVSQTAGLVPDQSIPPPPPPAAFPQERFSYLRNDSVMRLSSMSLDTTDSSILDDSRNNPRSNETDLSSPIFPSGGTFVPFSANDVGVKNGRRTFIAANTSIAPTFLVRSSSTADGQRKTSEEGMSPRRSMTTASRNPSNASNRSNALPRRSESLSSTAPQRNSSLRVGTPGSMASYQNGNQKSWRSPTSNLAHTPHVSQFHQGQPPVYETEQFENDPFYGGSPASNGTLFSVGSPGQSNGYMPQSPMQRSSLSVKSPLPSALKSSNSHRKSKGHRRQNCVRISIHPPMTFGGSAFSPTVEEEPEDLDAMEEVDLRESTINGTSKSQPSLSINTPSPLPLSKRGSGSRRTKSVISAPSSLGPLAEEPQPTLHTRTPSKKRKKAPTDNQDDTPVLAKGHALPGILTSLPPAREVNLSHTPSPEREDPLWAASNIPTHENASGISTGSPRRPPLKGPRTQPGKPGSKNSPQSQPPKSMKPLMRPTSPLELPHITGTQGSDWRKSTDSSHRPRTGASTGSFRRNRDSQGSLASGFDSSMRPISPACGSKGSNVRDKVTIWEDANRSASPTKPHATQFGAGYTFQLDANLSPTHVKGSIPRSLSKNGNHSPIRMAGRAPPTPTSTRRGMMTPNGKGLGIGVTCATPVSLYDGEGFLKE
ncbi:uncharacterized protein N7496_004327 [Penicillium cataractarum]|uniref:Uncharacterized protein n=1 Tax=Penicillium cataractarum TaxID=2100454 RepID=A0A9W9SQA8_9EURO|nr:uncharacterized protein N7496_004327 [Penicillium cataractarum]KAJ5381899.1 hypothetical protein N7496_004327 [Penicillium cataractarum]